MSGKCAAKIVLDIPHYVLYAPPMDRVVQRALAPVCMLTDHDYDWTMRVGLESYCRRCGSDVYWPRRRTLGRLLEALHRGYRRWRLRGDDDDIPF